jgi:hypothetical protein
MKTPIIQGFDKQNLDTYLNARQYSALYWPSLFPVKPVNTLDGKTIIGSMGSRIAAYVTSYDAKAPEVGRKTLATKYFDIPKISIARKKTEREILEHHITRQLRGNDAVIEDYFGDVDFVWDAVNARMEWMALQALSLTKITLSTSNNPLGIVTETAVDFGMAAANKKVATTATWSVANAATMVPITDFKAARTAARALGIQLNAAVMSADMFDIVVGSAQFQDAAKSVVKGYESVVGVVGIDTANAVLTAMGLPRIIVVDTSVGVEDAAGNVTYANPWDANHVLFVPSTNMGNMFSGPIAEEIEKPEGVVQSKRGNILVSVKKDFDPVAVVTKGESNSFPSWPTIDQCINLYVGDTATWA